MRKIVIGVTTFERPQLLRRTLKAIAALKCTCEIHVFVADNSFEKQSGIAVVNEVRELGFPFPLSAFAVSGRGFTYPRNALLSCAFEEGDFEGIALVDDDQRPEPNWLQELIDMQKALNADIVAPVVMPEFEKPPSIWARTSQTYFRDASADGLVSTLSGDGGILLMRRATLLVAKPWYNQAFGMTGGADSDLFQRLKDKGARFARAPHSVIHEFYPISRMSLAWAFKRAYRGGNSTILIEREHTPRHRIVLRELPLIVAGLFIGPLLAAVYLWSPGQAVDMISKAFRASGKLAALFGSKYFEYDKIHGK